jgi:uncharacterized protein (DUF433 family)
MAVIIDKYIEQNKNIRNGKPHIVDTRITVSDIVTWHLRMGQSLEEVAVQYSISLAAVHSAMSYYYDHKSEIDADIDAGYNFYVTNKKATPSLVQKKLRNPQ